MLPIQPCRRALIWFRFRFQGAVILEQIQPDVVGYCLFRAQHLLSHIKMEHIRPNRCSLEFPSSLYELGDDSLEHDSPIDFLFPQQSIKDDVADCHRDPGWLFRIKDGDEEFQHPLGSGILTVGYGKSVFRVRCIPELLANKFFRSGGKSLPSHIEPICFPPFLCPPGFRMCSDGPFVLVRGSCDKLLHHLLILDRLGFAHQPYASDPNEVLFQIGLLSGLLWDSGYYGAKCEWLSHGCCGRHRLLSPSCFQINPLELHSLIWTTQRRFSLFSP